MTKTIIAAATAQGRAGVIVVRVSGANSGKLIETLTLKAPPLPRMVVLRDIIDLNGELIDKALVLFFKSPNSFTGEDIAEFHLHGSKAILAAFIEAAIKTDLCTMAGPGDFTRQAFENGKMDLSAAEGLADLIDAETQGQRRQALRQMGGALGDLAMSWRAKIIDAMAHAEAYIDFPDEDLPDGLNSKSRNIIGELLASLQVHLLQSSHAQRVRDGISIAIIGAPNAGKSSLLNALARREAAIVSARSGTTRDIVEVSFVLDGNLFFLADTAGIRETGDEIEAEGVRRAIGRAKESDLRIGLAEKLADISAIAERLSEGDILVLSKIDLPNDFEIFEKQTNSKKLTVLQLSTKTNIGVAKLEKLLIDFAHNHAVSTELPPLTRLRHRIAIQNAIAALENVVVNLSLEPEIIVEELRLAARHLGSISGLVGVDDVLDNIFSSFCIGK